MALLKKDTPLVYISGINVHIGIVALGQDDTSEVSLFFPSLSHFGSHQSLSDGSIPSVWEFTGFFSD